MHNLSNDSQSVHTVNDIKEVQKSTITSNSKSYKINNKMRRYLERREKRDALAYNNKGTKGNKTLTPQALEKLKS